MTSKRSSGKRLRVMMLDPAASAPWVAHSLSNALAGLGCEVHIVSGAHWDRTIGDLPREYALSRPFYKRTQIRAYEAESQIAKLFWQGLRLVGHVWTLARLLPTVWKVDLLHVQFLPLPALDHLWLKMVRWKTPVVLTVHDPMPHAYKHRGFPAAIRKRLYAIPQKLIAHTTFTEGELRRDFGVPAEKIATIPYGAFEHMRAMVKGAPEPAGDPPVILFVGQISPRKGLDVLLRAAVRLHAEGLRFRVRVMGFPRMDMRPIFDLVRQDGIADLVNFDLAWLSEQQIARAMHNSHIIALPYRIVNQSAVATVACTLGRAMVATEVGGLPELVRAGNCGLVVPLDDDAAFAEALGKLLRDPALRERLANNGIRHAEHVLNWNVLAKRTLQVYREASDRGAGELKCARWGLADRPKM